ncbi:NAD(P)H-dependent glycerol-3-phosphate dehydrogenase [Vagococcus zengguangii]|uniref:Glycerol-3-phosphate dehydrogenase [NAD(P)+] n=1 Tax=Vagococcus zengguangii TaxID=2571750 RepID=A0A4D7CQ77_9ENTE|nr:NAD(P)H-dependent glycerol-3-phosphate dehydrogenase [Vagococcus zengguangii]QCI86219.1 NAD(P)H-dependent glycerol-3-phosphate dehydrogenase [Vagococcus zengguangii]
MKQKVAVLGTGSWGLALGQTLIENGHDVVMWGRDEAQVAEIQEHHTNKAYLPNIVFPERLTATTNMADAVQDADAILFVVPTKAIRQVARQLVDVLTTVPVIIHASKGFEQETHFRISEILAQEIPSNKRKDIVVLSGPSHAEEVAVHDLTTITAASKNEAYAIYVQKLFSNGYFRVYTNDDVIGVETGAALKNIIALGAGAIHGLGLGDNAKAAIMTRGLAEITRLGVAMGADPLTFIGLSGFGDLIVTCTSIHSRNWRTGDMLGKGKSLDEILSSMGMIVEGVSTTKSAYELAQELEVEMPITEAIYQVLYENKDVHYVIEEMMKRDNKSEKEF